MTDCLRKVFIMGFLVCRWMLLNVLVTILIKALLAYVFVVTLGIYRQPLAADKVSKLWEENIFLKPTLKWINYNRYLSLKYDLVRITSITKSTKKKKFNVRNNGSDSNKQ